MSNVTPKVAPVLRRYVIGQVIQKGGYRENTVKIKFTKLKLDKYLNKYFNKRSHRRCLDADPPTKLGDIVLLESLDKSAYPGVDFGIRRVLYKVGETVDPITGRRCRGKEFIDMEQRQKLYKLTAEIETPEFEMDAAPEVKRYQPRVEEVVDELEEEADEENDEDNEEESANRER